MTRRWWNWEWLALAVLVAVLVMHVWFPRVGPGPLNDTYNVDVGGRKAFYRLAERRLNIVDRNQRSLEAALPNLPTDATLCFLGPARYPQPREWQALLNWVAQGGSLLFAARWDEPELSVEGLNLTIEPTSSESVLDRMRASREMKQRKKKDKDKPKELGKDDDSDKSSKSDAEAKDRKPSESVETKMATSSALTWKSKGKVVVSGNATVDVLLSDENGPQVVRTAYGAGNIVLLASDYIFSNESLAAREKQNGVLAFRLLEAADAHESVVFDESLNATGTPKVVGLVLDATLRPITLQVLVVFVVFAWRGNRRFGGLLPKELSSRHDIADHTNALGNLYYKVGDPAAVLRSYLEQRRIEWHLRFVAGAKDTRGLEPLARRLRTPVDELKQLLAEAEGASQQKKLHRRDAAKLIRRLASLRHKKS
ncbi:MAG: DUF4350 domain-containing protein [Planctomycetales bacterium]|nr:DUF4350 domain-containing protein [Planctomycetales bacterium]